MMIIDLWIDNLSRYVVVKDSGDEPQRLAEFITDLMERNILNEVFYKLPDNAMKSMVYIFFTIDVFYSVRCMYNMVAY